MGVRGQYVFLLTLDKGHFITDIEKLLGIKRILL